MLKLIEKPTTMENKKRENERKCEREREIKGKSNSKHFMIGAETAS